MLDNYDEVVNKYSDGVLKGLNEENIYKIITFLDKEKCDYIDELLEDYLDLFTLDYDYFVNKYNELNNKYNGSFLNQASEDMNLLEEFFN